MPSDITESPIADTIDELRVLLKEFPRELELISDREAGRPRAGGGWSRKQILGHLIDSAAVNHQRFVRAQLESGFSFLYEQTQWVDLQRYQERPWHDLIDLWTALNRHLLWAIEVVPEEKLQNLCGQGDGDPWTLAYRIPDYLTHLRHHIEQVRRFE